MMDREISSEVLKRERIKKYGQISGIIILIVMLLFTFRSCLKPDVRAEILHTATAEKGAIEASITASGTVVPEFEQVIASPIQSKIDSVFFRAGTQIEKGSSILALNNEFITISLNRLKDELALKQNKKTQLKLTLERQLIDLKSAYDIKKLKIESLGKKAEQEEHLYKIGAGSKNEMDNRCN